LTAILMPTGTLMAVIFWLGNEVWEYLQEQARRKATPTWMEMSIKRTY